MLGRGVAHLAQLDDGAGGAQPLGGLHADPGHEPVVDVGQHHAHTQCQGPELVQRRPTLWPQRIPRRQSQQNHW